MDGTSDNQTSSDKKEKRRIARLEKTVRQLAADELGDRMSFRRLLYRNFIAGLARGGGTIVGIALVGTALVFFLQWAARANMEGVSAFVTELIRWIQRNM